MSIYFIIRILDMQVYETKLLPAYRKFMRGNDPQPLIALGEEAIARMTRKEKKDFDYLSLSEGIGILNGSVFYNSKGDYKNQETRKTTLADKKKNVLNSFAPSLLLTLCNPRIRGLVPEQNMSKTALYDYLYYCSDWVQDVFTTAQELRGGDLEIPLGECPPVLFSDLDIREFQQVMREVANPNHFGSTSEIQDYFCQHLKAHLKVTFPKAYREQKKYYELYAARFENWLKWDEAQLKKDFNNLIKLLRLVEERPHLRLMLYLS